VITAADLNSATDGNILIKVTGENISGGTSEGSFAVGVAAWRRRRHS
jgi:hypothetical protein